MNIFVDMHHGSLLHSFQMMADRLGATLYRPGGIEWFEQELWKINNQRDTANQYLAMEPLYIPKDGTPPLNVVQEKQGGVYLVHDTVHDCVQRAITLEAFNKMPFDVIISSISQHDEIYAKLAKDKGAKHVAQTGNIYQRSNAENQLISNGLVPTKHFVEYHPEFETLFHYEKPTYTNRITTFLNCLKFHREDYKQWLKLKAELPDWNFKSYGGQCDDGGLHEITSIAKEMQDSNFIWHRKTEGDGYGFVVHYAFASGRPLLINYSAYKDKTAGKLMQHEETIIDLDRFDTHSQLAEYLKALLNDKPRYESMCENVRKKFDEHVNFDAEAVTLKEFFNTLV